MATLTKKDLLEAIEDMPMDAEIVPHEKSNEHKDAKPYVSYDRTKNQIILFVYYHLSHV